MSSKLFSLDGKVAVVTGGTRGLGYDIARGYLEAGAAKVFVTSRKAEDNEKAEKELNEYAKKNSLKGVAVGVASDVSAEGGAQGLADTIAETESKVDILVANAGVASLLVEDQSLAAFDVNFNVNVRGVYATIKALLPLLEKAGTKELPARIIVTGSVVGVVSFSGGGFEAYSASKAAVHHLVRIYSSELGPKHITVNTIAPAVFPSQMSQGIVDAAGEAIAAKNPLGRLGASDDIIGTATYLASPAASYVNGVTLELDGGATKVFGL